MGESQVSDTSMLLLVRFLRNTGATLIAENAKGKVVTSSLRRLMFAEAIFKDTRRQNSDRIEIARK